MKKTFIFASMLVGLTASAQDYDKRVGINTTTPRASLEVKAIDFDGRVQGILFPHISNEEKKKWQTNQNIGLVAGTVIWNEDLKCLDYFDGEKWQCTDGSNPYYPPVNTTPDKNIKADVWNRTHYIGSFNHNGANIDGVIDNGDNRIFLQIPYNQATVGGSYNEINVKRIVKDRNGNNVLLTLTIPAGTFTQAKGFLEGVIEVGNGTREAFSVRQLAANAEKVLTTFTFNINGNTSNVRLVASGGVLDRNFGQTNYNLIYVPVSVYTDHVDLLPNRGPHYEKKWLNNNLGAYYAKVGNNQHTQQATSHDDYNAYGSLFQWQRPADGHELVDWTSSTTGTLTPTTDIIWDNINWKPNHSQFIRNYYTWVSETIDTNPSYHNLWQSGQPNNPCPKDYHVPTKFDWSFLVRAMDSPHSYSYTYWATRNSLHLPVVGYRSGRSGSLSYQGHYGYYWSSTSRSSNDYSILFGFNQLLKDEKNFNFGTGYEERTVGFPVRCIAD